MVSRVDADWVVGELRGSKGMFPAGFVDKVPENLPQEGSGGSSKEKTESSSQPTVTMKKVNYMYTVLCNTVWKGWF